MKNYVISVLLISLVCGLIESRYVGGYYFSATNLKPEDLNPNLLTHLYYAFLLVNDNGTFTIQNEQSGFAHSLADLKNINPDLKLLFSLSNVKNSFSTVVADPNLRKAFVQNAFDLVQKYNYDGLDFDWEFPVDKDKENFISLLSETYAVFKEHNLTLTAAVRSIPIYNNSGYIVPEMSKYLDIINIMTYDFYGSWSSATGQNSPLYPHPLDTAYERKYLNINASVHNWISAGAPKSKLAMGLPFYGRTFTLQDTEQHGVHAPSLGGGTPPSPSYYVILRDYQNYTTEWNDDQKSPYKYSGSTWLAYEDIRSIEIKANYAVENDLAGVFIWQLAGDDVYGKYSKKKQVLLQTINDVIHSV